MDGKIANALIDLPGIKCKDIWIMLCGNALTVFGIRRRLRPTSHPKGRNATQELKYSIFEPGVYQRSFDLPFGVHVGRPILPSPQADPD